MTSQQIVDIYQELSKSNMNAMVDMIDEEQKYNANPDDETRSYRDRAIANWEKARRAYIAFAEMEWQTGFCTSETWQKE